MGRAAAHPLQPAGRPSQNGSPAFMEPATQALLGAATAEIVVGKSLRGYSTLGWGALIGMSPDLDVLLGPLQGGYGEWLYHRGTSHSLWFGFVAGPMLGWGLWRWRDPDRGTPLSAWIILAIVALVTHPLLDGFTPYGTQFFAPFVRDRFAWNGVAIVDPFYSIILGAGVFFAATKRVSAEKGQKALIVCLALSTSYLFAGLAVNRWVEDDLRQAVAQESLGGDLSKIERVKAYPTIFQPWLRSFVLQTDDMTFVGLHSWQEAGCPAWQAHPRKPLSVAIRAMITTQEAQLLDWFADGDTATFVHREPNGVARIRIEDVRYSWASANGRGMWGLEARVTESGEILGGIRRFPRPSPSTEDIRRIERLLLGELPEAGGGWVRPAHCTPNPR
jgi:inner membrane protein